MTNIPVGLFLLGIITACVVAVGFDLSCSNMIVTLIGTAYPVVKSILALESADKADDIQWLTYWMVFSVFTLFEGIG